MDSRELLCNTVEARDGNREVTAAENGRPQWRSSSARESGSLAHDLSGDAFARERPFALSWATARSQTNGVPPGAMGTTRFFKPRFDKAAADLLLPILDLVAIRHSDLSGIQASC